MHDLSSSTCWGFVLFLIEFFGSIILRMPCTNDVMMMWFLDFLMLEKKRIKHLLVKSLDRFSPGQHFFYPQNRWNHLLLSRSLALKRRFWLRLFLPRNHFFQPGETWGMLLGDGSFGSFDMWILSNLSRRKQQQDYRNSGSQRTSPPLKPFKGVSKESRSFFNHSTTL